jgi:hypothetical protein
MVGFAWFVILGWPDLPASATWLLLAQVIPDSLESFFTNLFRGHIHPFANFGGFWLPLLCYGIIGTWWWWILPAIIAGSAKLLRAAYRRVTS